MPRLSHIIQTTNKPRRKQNTLDDHPNKFYYALRKSSIMCLDCGSNFNGLFLVLIQPIILNTHLYLYGRLKCFPFVVDGAPCAPT